MLLDIFYNVIVSFFLGVCSCPGIPGHLCCPFAFLVEIIIAAVVAIVVGFLIGYFLMQKVLKERNDATALEAQNALADAQREAESMKREALVEAKDEVLKMKQDAERESK